VETRACALDAKHKETRAIAAPGHDWGEWAGENVPTCTQGGSGTRTCKRVGCGKTETGDDIPALGHNYVWTLTNHATCNAKGEETEICSHDKTHTGEKREIPIDDDAHVWEAADGGVAPTCTADGHGTVKCDVCGEEKTADVLEKLGHNEGEWHTTLDPDCEHSGAQELRCTRIVNGSTCGEILDTETISALGHDWEWIETTPASYTVAGVETETCKHDPAHTRDTRPIPQIPFTSIAEFRTWLNAQPANTAAAPYAVVLKVGNLGGDYETSGSLGNALYTNSGKYVSLDLSDCTFTSIVDRAFQYCSSLAGVTIPNSVTSISNRAFHMCTSLAGVTIPDSITSIGDNAFYECRSLTSVTIPNRVTSIGDGAFGYCTSLASVTIPNSVTSIGYAAFRTCNSLASVNIGNGVTSIKGEAFSYCPILASVTCLALTPPTLNGGVFTSTHASLVIKVPPASVSAYKAAYAKNWDVYASRIVAIEP
jgi:hypothetical protein